MKKVLVITYYWPPAGGAGVQRTLKFTKYLPEYGWKPYVLTVEKPDAPVYDESLFADVHPETEVIKTKALEPFEAYKKFTGKNSDEKIPADVLMKETRSPKEKIAKFVRANFFVPDAKIGWLPYALKKGKEIIEREKINIIYASSPPQTVALIGYKLAKQTGLKFVADFRDPWLEIVYNQKMKRSKITVAVDASLEKKVLSSADAVITVSEDIMKLLQSKALHRNYHVIPNGYDETDFPETEPKKNEKFTVAYTGVMSPERVPYAFLSALAEMKKNGTEDIRCVFAGKFAEEFYNEIKRLEIEDFFEIKSFVPHSESVRILLAADALLLVINRVPDNKGILTGKMFEYLGCKKPIFGIGPTDGEAAEILRDTESGVMIDYDDTETAYEKLFSFYSDWKNGETKFKFKTDKFSRKRLTEKLARIFDNLIDGDFG
jgi:glycosyltransferase involved in cell wall biosynthesis